MIAMALLSRFAFFVLLITSSAAVTMITYTFWFYDGVASPLRRKLMSRMTTTFDSSAGTRQWNPVLIDNKVGDDLKTFVENSIHKALYEQPANLTKVEVTRNIRNTTMHSLCAVEDLNHVDVLNSEQRRTLYGQLLVDDAHKFIYCFVPKVACSNWKRVIKYMNGKVPDLETPMKMDHHKDLVTLTEFNDEEVAYRLKNYYKFMFVRDPTERLLSAYRNKFGENIGTYNAKYAPKIIAKYRKPGTIIEGADQSRITFEEFLRFLVDSDTRRMDPHWRPMHELCQPCAINYDFIGSFEQLSEDASLVLDKIRGQSDAYFPKRQSWYKPTTNDKLEREINNVKEVYMKQVVDKYARDFMLFGYQPRVSEVTRPKRL